MPKNRGTCGIAVPKSTVKATVLVPQKNGAAVVPWYSATLISSLVIRHITYLTKNLTVKEEEEELLAVTAEF